MIKRAIVYNTREQSLKKISSSLSLPEFANLKCLINELAGLRPMQDRIWVAAVQIYSQDTDWMSKLTDTT